MFNPIILLPLAAVFQSLAPQQPVAPVPAERKVRIEVVTTENGETKRSMREFDANDKAQMEDAMRELGVMEHMSLGNGDGKVNIDIRSFGDGDDDRTMRFQMAPTPPVAPVPPVPPMAPMMARTYEPVGYLGVSTKDLGNMDDSKNRGKLKEGAFVTDVVDDSPAAKLGLKEGDIITHIDAKAINGPDGLSKAIKAHEPGAVVKVAWMRDGKKMNGSATLTENRAMKNVFMCKDGDDAFEWTDEMGDGAKTGTPRAFLGVTPADDEDEANGVRIGSVEDGSAAATMGMKEGDVVRKINGNAVIDFDALAKLIKAQKPGDAVTVDLTRNGKDMTLKGTLGERKVDRMRGLNGMRQFNFDGMAPEDRESMRSEMDELRREMTELRRELGKDIRRETRITIESRTLTPEEKALLGRKGVSGLDKELTLGDLQAFPNPSNGMFRIQFDLPERGDLSVDVHDATGERVYQQRITGFKGRFEHTLDLTDRSSGSYYLVISQGGKTATRKLVKE